MNREIKFRAWWKDAKLMADVEVWRDSDVLINVPIVSSIPGHTHEKQLLEEDQYILMQYTGLKDKNGNEIYEGDILESNLLLGEGKTRSVVRWNEAGFIANGALSNERVYMQNHALKIIGNIYENPELMENHG